jgi:hypothetical protein
VLLFTKTSRSAVVSTLAPMQWVPGSFPGLKRRKFEVDHSSENKPEVKNDWSHTSTPPICFHDMDRDNFTVLFHVTDFQIIKDFTSLL